jgi:hypothetical protein
VPRSEETLLTTKTAGPNEVRLRATIHGPNRAQIQGVTEYISHSEIRFAVEEPYTVNAGTPLLVYVEMPHDITAGNSVYIRIIGEVSCVDYVFGWEKDRLLFTVRVKSYGFMRGDALYTAGEQNVRALRVGMAS